METLNNLGYRGAARRHNPSRAHVPLWKWLMALFTSSASNSVAVYEVRHTLGVTNKTTGL